MKKEIWIRLEWRQRQKNLERTLVLDDGEKQIRYEVPTTYSIPNLINQLSTIYEVIFVI
jgi:hypothetical protein